jgi:hypothetical protein
MTYRGHIKNGVVIFPQPLPLADGTEVEVLPLQASAPTPRPGNPDTILKHNIRWAGPPEELDRLLREVQQMREEDLIPDDA